jgi:hypothetical protein
MSELKPCPFSGAKPYFKSDVQIRSDECNILMSGVQGKEELARVWNTRTAPKVKQLEWEKLHKNFYRAPLIGDVNIRVETYDQKEWMCLYSVPGYCNTLVDGKFKSAEEAKAAAQSHYEKQILEALE